MVLGAFVLVCESTDVNTQKFVLECHVESYEVAVPYLVVRTTCYVVESTD